MASDTPQALSPFAAALQEARLAKALSIGDAARALLLSENQIQGLEQDDLRAFYGPAYADRAARRYAELLGVDIGLRGEVLPEPAPALTPVHALSTGVHRGSKPFWRFALVGTAVAAGIGAIAIVVPRPTAAPLPAETVATVSTPTPIAAAVEQPTTLTVLETPPVIEAPPVQPPVPEPIAASARSVPDDLDHRFYLVVTRDVIIQARDANGAVLLSGTQAPNMGQRIEGFPPFSVAVSDESAIELYYRGQRIRSGPMVYEGISLAVTR